MKCKVCGKEVAAVVSGVCLPCLRREIPVKKTTIHGLFVVKRDGLYRTRSKPRWDKLSLAKVYATLSKATVASGHFPGSAVIPLDECG